MIPQYGFGTAGSVRTNLLLTHCSAADFVSIQITKHKPYSNLRRLQRQRHVVADSRSRIDSRVSECRHYLYGISLLTNDKISSADGRLRNYDIRMGQLQEDYIGGIDLALDFGKQLSYLIYLPITFFSAAITSVRMSKDRNCILVSTTDDTIRLMDKANGTLLNEYVGQTCSRFPKAKY